MKWVSVVLAIALFAVVGAVTSAASVGSAGAQTRPFEGQVVTILGGETSPEMVATINASLDAFELTSGMTVVYTPALDPAGQLALQIEAGTRPDLALVDTAQMQTLSADGLLAIVPALFAQEAPTQYPSDLLDLARRAGILYGVPVDVDITSSVWYKPSIFDANGYAVPLLWDGLTSLSNRMINDGNSPFCLGVNSATAPGDVLTDWIEDVLLRLDRDGDLVTDGPEIYDGWAAHEIAFSDPRVVAAFEEVLELWSTAGFTRRGIPGILADDEVVEPAEGLSANECAMVKQGVALAGSLTAAAANDVDVFPLPTGIGEDRLIVDATWAVGLTSRAATQEALAYLGSTEYGLRRAQAQRATFGALSGFVSPRVELRFSPTHPAERSMAEALHTADLIRSDASDHMDPEVAELFRQEALAMLSGKPIADVVAAIDAVLPPIEIPLICAGLEPTIMGTDGDDVLTGTLGNDVIYAGDGDDVVVGGGGNDVICGGLGNDTIWGNSGDDLIRGDEGDDKLRGGPGADEVHGGAGADDVAGSAGNDVVDGGAGNDIAVRGGVGDDIVSGGEGDDVLVNGNGGLDEVNGDAGADLVIGGPRPDEVRGGDGNDEVKGSGGADRLWGGPGDDLLIGGKQPDTLDGGAGIDECRGGTEPDSGFACETLPFPLELACLGHYIAGNTADGGACVTLNIGCPFPQLELETASGTFTTDPDTGQLVPGRAYSCVPSCNAPATIITAGRCVVPFNP